MTDSRVPGERASPGRYTLQIDAPAMQRLAAGAAMPR